MWRRPSTSAPMGRAQPPSLPAAMAPAPPCAEGERRGGAHASKTILRWIPGLVNNTTAAAHAQHGTAWTECMRSAHSAAHLPLHRVDEAGQQHEGVLLGPHLALPPPAGWVGWPTGSGGEGEPRGKGVAGAGSRRAEESKAATHAGARAAPSLHTLSSLLAHGQRAVGGVVAQARGQARHQERAHRGGGVQHLHHRVLCKEGKEGEEGRKG